MKKLTIFEASLLSTYTKTPKLTSNMFAADGDYFFHPVLNVKPRLLKTKLKLFQKKKQEKA